MIKDGNFKSFFSVEIVGTPASVIIPNTDTFAMYSDMYESDLDALVAANNFYESIADKIQDEKISDEMRFNDTFLNHPGDSIMDELEVETENGSAFMMPNKFDINGDNVEMYREINFRRGRIKLRICSLPDVYMHYITMKPEEATIVRN